MVPSTFFLLRNHGNSEPTTTPAPNRTMSHNHAGAVMCQNSRLIRPLRVFCRTKISATTPMTRPMMSFGEISWFFGSGLSCEPCAPGWYDPPPSLVLRSPQVSGTSRASASSHVRADMSDGARQSPRGDRDPPAETFGPFGSAERLNWLKL